MTLFGSSGARGTLEEGFDPPLVARIAQAATNRWGAHRVAIGRDGRLTGPSFAAAAVAGVTAAGADALRLGVVPTPAVQHFARLEGVPAIAITASHNPPPDNGIKLTEPDGGELGVDAYRAVEDRLDGDGPETAAWDGFGSVRRVSDAGDRYVRAVRDAVAADRIDDAGLTVVVDPANGPGGATSPRLFRELGCSVHTVNAQLDGHFPGRSPEPVPAVLDDLAAMVRATDADLGVAHDGDADRAIFVDETGAIVEGGASLAALAAATAEAGDAIVSAITASLRLRAVADGVGADLVLTRVGAAHLVTEVRALHADGRRVAVAGEGNGGAIFPKVSLARDGAYAAARFLELIAERPTSAVVEPYTGYAFRRRDLRYGDPSERAAMLDRAKRWVEGQPGPVRTVDGYRVDLEDGWVLIRASGTEPLVRVYAEAEGADRAEALLDEAVGAVA